VQSWKIQTIEVTKDVNGVGFKLVMKEVNSFRGIPYSDYFSVVTEWVVVALPPASSSATPTCKATVYLDFEFHKYTWLQGTIESNTKAELIEVYELWLASAQESLRKALDRKMSTLSTLHALNESLKGVEDNDDMELAPLRLELETGRAAEAEGELAVSDGERSRGGRGGGDSGTPSAPPSGGSTPGMLFLHKLSLCVNNHPSHTCVCFPFSDLILLFFKRTLNSAAVAVVRELGRFGLPLGRGTAVFRLRGGRQRRAAPGQRQVPRIQGRQHAQSRVVEILPAGRPRKGLREQLRRPGRPA